MPGLVKAINRLAAAIEEYNKQTAAVRVTCDGRASELNIQRALEVLKESDS